MKKVLVIAGSLVLGATLAMAGEAKNINIKSTAKNTTNKVGGMMNKAEQNVQSVNVGTKGSAKNINIKSTAKNTTNTASGMMNTATQNVQSVNVK
jgi:hypothetical protein